MNFVIGLILLFLLLSAIKQFARMDAAAAARLVRHGGGVLGMIGALLLLLRGRIGLAAALAGGILAAPHAYVADCALLIPAVLIVLANAERGWIRALCVFLLTPIPCLFLLLEISFYLQALLLMFLLAIARPGTKKWETGGIKRPPALPALA